MNHHWHICTGFGQLNTVQVGNSWRTTADIRATWEDILRCLDNNVGLAQFAGPGAWNDPDMLEVRLDRGPHCRQHGWTCCSCVIGAPTMIRCMRGPLFVS